MSIECFEIQAISIHISEKVLPLMGSLRALGAVPPALFAKIIKGESVEFIMQSCSGVRWRIDRTQKILYVVSQFVNIPLLLITAYLPFHFPCLRQM